MDAWDGSALHASVCNAVHGMGVLRVHGMVVHGFVYISFL